MINRYWNYVLQNFEVFSTFEFIYIYSLEFESVENIKKKKIDYNNV